MHLGNRPGWVGVFSTDEAPGAMRNGTRIVKSAKDPGDARGIGATGTVLGSLSDPEWGLCYFIEWDSQPRVAVAVIAWKVQPLKVQ